MPPANEIEQIQAMVASLDGARTDSREHATEEDLADVDEVLETVTPDGDAEEPSASAVATVAAVLEEEEDVIEKLIRSSREKRGGVHEAQTKADLILRQAEEKAAGILQKAESTLTERAQRLLTTMLQDPMAAAAELRVNPEEVIRATAEANEPNARALRELRGELTKRERETAELRTMLQKLVTDREAEARDRQREHFNRAQEKFVSDADRENFPAINLFWGKKRFLGEAFEESQAINEAASILGGRPEVSDRQIIARLEKRAREELKAVAKDLVALVQALEKGAAAPAKKEEEKEPAKKAKTIAPAASTASTKAAAAPKRKFKSDEEEHAYLVKVAQEILSKQAARKTKVA